MTGRIILLIGLIAVCAGGYLWWQDNFVSGTWRYKLTVTVDTPEGLKTGSAVHEVSNAADKFKFLKFPDSKNIPEFRGEAVVVDLGSGKFLFGLVGTNPYELFYSAFPVQGASTYEGIRYFNTLQLGTKATLTRSQYPTFVTFTDINDPKTVKQVDPDDLAASFGEGVALSSITLEMTDEPIVWKMKEYLGDKVSVGSYEFVRGNK